MTSHPQRRPVPASRANDPAVPRNAPLSITDLTFEPVELNGGRFGVLVTPRARRRGAMSHERPSELRGLVIPVDVGQPNAFRNMVDGFINAARAALESAGLVELPPEGEASEEPSAEVPVPEEESAPVVVCAGCGLRLFGDRIPIGTCQPCEKADAEFFRAANLIQGVTEGGQE